LPARGLPFHVLGVADPDGADFAALVQFGDSVVRLAEVARRSGRAVEAVNELWPLVARLEARAADGRIERDTLHLLASARLALGVSLGTVLPEERLTGAAAWTGKALVLARPLDDEPFSPPPCGCTATNSARPDGFLPPWHALNTLSRCPRTPADAARHLRCLLALPTMPVCRSDSTTRSMRAVG